MVYKFSKCASAEKPDNGITQLLEKVQEEKALTRTEKDRVAELLYGVFGPHSSVYRTAGWAWDMSCLPRILVRFNYNNNQFEVYRAPDKTSLRKCLHDVREMVYA